MLWDVNVNRETGMVSVHVHPLSAFCQLAPYKLESGHKLASENECFHALDVDNLIELFQRYSVSFTTVLMCLCIRKFYDKGVGYINRI